MSRSHARNPRGWTQRRNRGGRANASGASSSGGIWAAVSGGTPSADATYNYQSFTANGTLTVTRAGWIAYLVQGGGGAAGDGQSGNRYDSGGAGGQARTGFAYVTPGTIAVTVGAAGAALNPSQNGTDGGAGGTSQLGSIATATGGEGGGTDGIKEGGDNADYNGSGAWGSNGSGHGAGAGGGATSTTGGPGITWVDGLEYGGGGAGGDNSGGSSSSTSHGGGDYGQPATRPGAGSGANGNHPGAAGIVKIATAIDPAYAPIVSRTYSYVGAAQTFDVPLAITELTIDMAGAEGYPSGASAGQGARVQCTLPVTPGEQLQVNVGGAGGSGGAFGGGGNPGGGWNGGGGAGNHSGGGGDGNAAGGGGGATDIRSGGTALANRKVVAGGGGGRSVGFGGGSGGDGGTLTGADGTSGGANPQPGRGGTQSAGGAAGAGAGAGSLGQGGVGTGGSTTAGGGAGGGYYGGGGGGLTGAGGGGTGGGGGGSSYTDPACTDVVHTQGYRTGNGYCTISYALSI